MPSEFLKKYQQAFAAKIGAPFAFGFWKGRIALYAIIKGMGIT